MEPITLYHGSLMVVEKPLVNVGRKDLDFGEGFYVTDIRQQAVDWAFTLHGRSKKPSIPFLNIYQCAILNENLYKTLSFPEYNREWLDFICASRRGEKPWNGFDIIQGGIANDSVIDTVDAYMAGLIDVDTALGRLVYHKPNNQICILNQKIITESFTFVKAEKLK